MEGSGQRSGTLGVIEQLKPDIHTIRGKSIVAITQTRPIFEYIISIDKDALGKNIPSVKTEISNNSCRS